MSGKPKSPGELLGAVPGTRFWKNFHYLAPGREVEMAERWARLRNDPVAFGALQAPSRMPNDAFWDQLALFEDGAFEDAKFYVISLGLRRLLDGDAVSRLSRRALDKLVCRRVGARRCSIEGFDPAEQAAWFVVAFVIVHAAAFCPDVRLGEGEPIHVSERRERGSDVHCIVKHPDTFRIAAMIRLGRLLEW